MLAATTTGVFPARSQRAISSSSGVSPSRRVDQEQGDVGLAHRGFGLRAHPAGQRLRILVLVAGGIDHPEFQPEQARLALAPVAGHAGPVVDQRQLLADQPVEQRRFADIGTADDRDGGKRGIARG